MLDTRETPLGEQSSTATTRGWDTVYAINFADVNGAIERAGSSPAGFEYREGTSTTAGSGIDGGFGNWRMTGGSGRIVEMTLPVPAMFIREFGAQGQQIDAEERRHVSIVITLQLDSVPQPQTAPRADGGTVHELRVHLPNVAGPFGASVVTVDSVSYPEIPSGVHTQPGSADDEANAELIRILFADWINNVENLQKFNHVFCAVNLNAKAARGAFQWLMPVHLSYAVSAGPTPETGTFAVLCMTGTPDDRRPVPSTQDISPNVIPPGQNSAFLISKERFMAKMLMPGVQSMFAPPEGQMTDPETGTTLRWPGDFFEVAASGNMIRNTRPVVIPDFQGREEDDPAEARLDVNGVNLIMEDTYLEIKYTNLTHPFWWFWYDAIHNIDVHAHAMLTPDGKFMLTPPPEDSDDDRADHIASLVKTPTGQTIDNILIAMDVLAILVPVAKLGWGKFVSKGAKVVGDGASASAKISKAGAQAAMEVGVKTITAGAKTGKTVKAAGMLSTTFAKVYAGIVFALAVGLTVEKIIQMIGNDNDWAKNRIPDFKDFATAVMSPVQWSASAEFEPTDVRFNGSFQVSGTSLLPGDTSAGEQSHA